MATIKGLTKELNTLTEKNERLKALAYNLLLAAETQDQSAIEQSAGELRAWFDTEKSSPVRGELRFKPTSD